MGFQNVWKQIHLVCLLMQTYHVIHPKPIFKRKMYTFLRKFTRMHDTSRNHLLIKHIMKVYKNGYTRTMNQYMYHNKKVCKNFELELNFPKNWRQTKLNMINYVYIWLDFRAMKIIQWSTVFILWIYFLDPQNNQVAEDEVWLFGRPLKVFWSCLMYFF